jgi:hypothetical protein
MFFGNKKLLVGLLSALLIILLPIAWFINSGASAPTSNNGKDSGGEGPVLANASDYVEKLVRAGWNPKSAKAVVDLNADFFAIQAEENPTGLEIQLKLLCGLGKHPGLQFFLVDRPETAGLLASVDDPLSVADTLRFAENHGEYHQVVGFYLQHFSPSDAHGVAIALKDNHDLICRLHERGLLGCELMFIFDRNVPGGEEYAAWLREAVSIRIGASDEDLASFANLVFIHGPKIRKRLEESEVFRQRFRHELWPKMSRVVANDSGQSQASFEVYLQEDHLWDLLALENGEELLIRCGPLAIDLLFGYPEIDHVAYPKHLHKKIIQILLRNEEVAINGLMKFRNEPQFIKLLERDLGDELFSAVIKKLIQAGVNYPQKLSLYERLSRSALADDVGPPASGVITWIPLYYTVYEVPKKLLQGREPSGMELFSAAIDPVFVALDIFTFGTTAAPRKVLIAGGKEAVEQTTRKLTEKGVNNFFVITLRDTGLDLARKKLGARVADQLTDKELAPWAVTSLLANMQQGVREVLEKAARATTIEITEPVQFLFKHSGVGRESFKKITRLDAKLFMRNDAKIFVRLGNAPTAIVGAQLAIFLNRIAQDLTIGLVVESEPGQDALRGTVETAKTAAEQLKQWQQNVSAWWLLNASMLDSDLNSGSEPQ